MKTLCIFIITLGSLAILAPTSAISPEDPRQAFPQQLPIRALYKAVVGENPHPKLVSSVEIAIDTAGQPGLYWHRVDCTKVNGDRFSIWFLADGKVFNSPDRKSINFIRYILQEPGQSPIEYIKQHSGRVPALRGTRAPALRGTRALLPMFNFREELLPRAVDDTNELLFAKGIFLGHPLVRQQFLEPQPIAPPENLTQLVLNPELLIGTSRNYRDDGTGRTKSGDYNYVRFTKEDYDEMIAAGFNYFTADAQQIEWICRRPVFYERAGGQKAADYFPEELYRSNFKGVVMFLDEPASRLAGKYPPNASPIQAINILREHIIKHHHSNRDYGNRSYRSCLTKAGIDLGSLKLAEPDIPIWETIICTSYYQLEVLPTGIIQECRWLNWPTPSSSILQRINSQFHVSIPIKQENLFLWYYSQMRGAARTFNAKWGMAIYGQAEPLLRLPSMKLAYDLGAAFIWFWTSDHDHHVPYREQLALTRALIDYIKTHPRAPLDKLLYRAKTAIVLPYGYTLPGCYGLAMFGSQPSFPLTRKNQQGITYKQVLAGAIKEIERCLTNNIPYDVVVAGKDFDGAGYEHLLVVQEDGSVRRKSKIKM